MTTVPIDVSRYVHDIRAALDDLPSDEIDDLTQGMEADLADVAAESGGPLRDRLGTPEEYAAELRAAAGLAPRAATSATARPLGVRVRARFAALEASTLQRWPWLPELAPIWWVLRGLAVAWLLSGAGQSGPFPLWALLLVPLSVWLGRASRGWSRKRLRLVALLNTGAILLAVPTIGWSVDRLTSSYLPEEVSYGTHVPTGLSGEGQPVTNVYVYDASGNRVERARLFDQAGRPLRIDHGYVPFTFEYAQGDPVPPQGPIEVFPHTEGDFDGWNGAPSPDGALAWTPPSVITPLLPAPGPTASAPAPAPSVTTTPPAGSTSVTPAPTHSSTAATPPSAK